MSFIWHSINRAFLFFIVVIVYSCGSLEKDKQESFEITKVHLDNQEPLLFSAYFDNPEFARLETTTENLFKKINSVCLSDEKIIAFSSFPDNLINIFDINGKHIKVIKNTGKGPKEIAYAISFDVDTCIKILDRGGEGKVVCFNFDGKFLNERKLGGQFMNMKIAPNGKLVFYEVRNSIFYLRDGTEIDKRLTIWDMNNGLKFINGAIPYNNNKIDNLLLDQYFSFLSDTMYYWDILNDTIFQMSLDSYISSPYRILDFGSSSTPKEWHEDLSSQKLFFKMRKNESAFLGEFMKTNNQTEFYKINRFGSTNIGIRNKNVNDVKCYKHLSLDFIHPNIVKEIKPNGLNYIGFDKDQNVFFSWESYDLIKTFNDLKKTFSNNKWNEFLESNKNLNDILKNIKADDNPILIICRIKE